LLVFFFAFFAFLAFLAMLPSATPVGSMQVYIDVHDEEYTTVQKLIRRVSNKVNGGGLGAAAR
jgi:hypothetical protein